MTIPQGEVEKVALLARLDLTEEEVAAFTKDLEEIIAAFKVLNSAPTSGEDPSWRPVEGEAVPREDEPAPGLGQGRALRLVRNKEGGFFKGPRATE